MNAALEHKNDTVRCQEGQDFSRKQGRRDSNTTWRQKKREKKHHMTSSSIQHSSEGEKRIFLRLQKYEPGNEKKLAGHRDVTSRVSVSTRLHQLFTLSGTCEQRGHQHRGRLQTCDAKQLFGCSAFSCCEVTALTPPTVTVYSKYTQEFSLIAAILCFESLFWVKHHALLLEVVQWPLEVRRWGFGTTSTVAAVKHGGGALSWVIFHFYMMEMDKLKVSSKFFWKISILTKTHWGPLFQEL